jgi:hypothetical protein
MALTPEGTPYVESTDLVANYPAASLSVANRIDLVGVLPFADAAARTAAIPSPTDGQFTYLQDTNSTEFYNGSAFQAIGGGKIFQIVRATDSTNRSTTSTSLVDASISVTITPQKSDSAIILIWNGQVGHDGTNDFTQVAITDNSNNVIIGGANIGSGTTSNIQALSTQIGYATPATTSATTYKLRFRVFTSGTGYLFNGNQDGQLYAIEVGA